MLASNDASRDVGLNYVTVLHHCLISGHLLYSTETDLLIVVRITFVEIK